MKSFLLIGIATLVSIAGYAQNSAVINQSGGGQVAVSQQGSGNTSVINQSNPRPGNTAVINQSGAGNVATVSQGGSAGEPGQSVSVSQSGHTETHINQTDGSNSIVVNQSGEPVPATSKKKSRAKRRTDRPR
ncbi:hypothetical protein [Spirosoma montaniterrae]|uniref:Curlin n=1 Tax=Spirosoma montaniterrae TaxID=1178516 RepID=A0A1P9WZN8_9BACT|nr:hypothetical protein [Spirosoma montaniterrae]AQG80857.1 hypothetical protein AWR27_16945 [Spirosoma montaniterrae]